MGGDEVLKYVQTLTEVAGDRRLDDRAVRLGHQAAHAGELTDLRRGAPGAGVGHHVDGVEGRLGLVFTVTVNDDFLVQVVHHRLGDLVVGARPDVDHLVVALTAGHQTGSELLLDLADFFLGGGDQLHLGFRDHHVLDTDGGAGQRRFAEAHVHDLVGEDAGFLGTENPVAGVQQLGDRLLGHVLVDHIEADAFGDDVPDLTAARGGLHQTGGFLDAAFLILDHFVDAHLDPRVQRHFPRAQGAQYFGDVGEHPAFAFDVHLLTADVVQTQNHVLGGYDDRLAAGGREDVVGGHHQRARFELGFQGQRHVHRHLVTVEVGVERRAHQRVQLDRLTFNQHRLERLDAQTVERGRPVQHHRVLADHLGEDVPHLGGLALDHLLGRLDGGGQAAGFQLGEDERLEQFQSHLLRQTGFVQLEGRAHHDHGTAGVVHPLTEQVLTETALLALDHVGQGLQRALVGTGDRAATAAVVQQRVHGLLQHALFVAHDDVRGVQVQQPLEAVVTVDHPAVEIVQVGGREAAAVQGHQRTQVRRQHRQHRHDHPLRRVAGGVEAFHQLETLGQLLQLGVGVGRLDVLAQGVDLFLQVELQQQLLDRLGAHLGFELITELLERVEVLFVGQQLTALQSGHTRLGHHEGLEVQHPLDVAQGHVQHQADARGQRLEEPDVRYRAGQLDVAHALTANLGEGDFNATLLTDHAPVLEPLVFTAQAFVVLDRTENTRAEQAITLRLERTVVDGLRLFHFAKRPGTDQVRRRQTDLQFVEFRDLSLTFEQIQQVFQGQSSVWSFRSRFFPKSGSGGSAARVARRPKAASRTQSFSSSILIPRDRISFSSTLKDSGMPGSIRWSPSTMFL